MYVGIGLESSNFHAFLNESRCAVKLQSKLVQSWVLSLKIVRVTVIVRLFKITLGYGISYKTFVSVLRVHRFDRCLWQ